MFVNWKCVIPLSSDLEIAQEWFYLWLLNMTALHTTIQVTSLSYILLLWRSLLFRFRYTFPFGRPEGGLKATLSLLERVNISEFFCLFLNMRPFDISFLLILHFTKQSHYSTVWSLERNWSLGGSEVSGAHECSVVQGRAWNLRSCSNSIFVPISLC